MKNFSKRILCVLVLLMSVKNIFSEEKLTAFFNENESAPFKFNIVLDSSLLGVGIAGFSSAYIIEKTLSKSVCNPLEFSLDDVNEFDKLAVNVYNPLLDTFGDVAVIADVLMPVAAFTIEALTSNMCFGDLSTVALMYAETVFLTEGIKRWIKISVNRPRPYVYTNSVPEEDVYSSDWHLSFPSGHSTAAFMSASFLSYTFASYFPESKWKIPVIALSYSIAVTTATLRVCSGNHFITDVATGAVLGIIMGFTVPFVHTLSNKNSLTVNSKTEVSILPCGVFVNVKI